MTLVSKIRQNQRVQSMYDEMTKESASEAGKAFLYTLGGGLASAGVAYGIPAAIEGVRGARIRAGKDKYVAKMRSAHPELKNYSKRDVDLVYNSLAMHSPKILKDPLVGGQVMVEALRRGNHMDLGQLSNVSKMTGGSGISEHEREAANLFAQQVGRGAQDYAGRKYDAKTDTRLSDAIAVEKVKGQENRRTQTYSSYLKQDPTKPEYKSGSEYKKRHAAYKRAKSP